jgi:hypothetical protein
MRAADAARSEIRDGKLSSCGSQLRPTVNIERGEEPTLASARESVDRTRTGLARDDRLSPEERNLWQELNEKVKHGVREIQKLGEALYEIREMKLYREDFPTWKDYCETILEMSKPQANRLIVGTEVLVHLAPFGVKNLPDGESQLRELARLPTAELRRSAWAAVLERDHTHTITAKVVREEVEKIRIQNGIPPARQDSGEDAKHEENFSEEKDFPDSKSPSPAEVKPKQFEADYHGPPWFEGRGENQFLLADGSECHTARATSEESFITKTQITAKLTSMTENNEWSKKHTPKSHISNTSVAERQRLLVALVDAINAFARQSDNPSPRETVFHAVEELSRLTTYLKPPTNVVTNPTLPDTSSAT